MTHDMYHLDFVKRILLYKIQLQQLYCYETLDDD